MHDSFHPSDDRGRFGFLSILSRRGIRCGLHYFLSDADAGVRVRFAGTRLPQTIIQIRTQPPHFFSGRLRPPAANLLVMPAQQNLREPAGRETPRVGCTEANQAGLTLYYPPD